MNADKDALRARLRTKRAALSAAFRRLSSDTIRQHVLTHPALITPATVALYAAIEAPHFEVETRALHDSLIERGCVMAYPRIQDNTLQFSHVRNAAVDFRMGTYNIPEPAPECPALLISDIDVLIVPSVAFTEHGDRLGQGGGYYDRVLGDPAFRGVSIGLAFAIQIVAELPSDSWDKRVDWIATEEGLFPTNPEK